MMKRLTLVTALLLLLLGCGAKQDGSIPPLYTSDISAEDCYLCGGGIENIASSYWGQDNIAFISLNTFEIVPVEINLYDRADGHLIEELTGTATLRGNNSQDGGFSAHMLLEHD